MSRLTPIPLLALLVLSSACSTAYYAAAEQLGWAHHDVLANRIQQASDALESAARQVAAGGRGLHRLAGAPAEERPARLRDAEALQADAGEDAAEMAPRLAAVQRAGDALFAEWSDDVATLSDAGDRARQQALLALSRQQYARVLDALRHADDAMAALLDTIHARLAPLARRLDDTDIDALRAALPAIDTALDALAGDVEIATALSAKYVAQLELSD